MYNGLLCYDQLSMNFGPGRRHWLVGIFCRYMARKGYAALIIDGRYASFC